MSCCGKKRNEWLNEVKSSSHQNSNENNPEAFIPEKPAREFEYTGDYSLTMFGVASGKPYHFRFKGDKLKIDYTDSFAMMAERDLIIITPQKRILLENASIPVAIDISEDQSHNRMR